MPQKQLIYGTIIACCIGFFTYAIYNNWLIFNLPFFKTSSALVSAEKTEKKRISIFVPDEQGAKNETRTILWSTNKADSCIHLVNEWLTVLDEEGLTEKKTMVQSASFSHNEQNLLLSFDHLPFGEAESTHTKWMIIESLTNTLHAAFSDLKNVAFLVHHQPAEDAHLDFSQPWPTQGFKTAKPPRNLTQPTRPASSPFTIMIDPEGDSQHTGRIIDDTFERGITLQCAEELKLRLESSLSGIRVILTRFPGETVEPLQNAAFSNRLKADLFIHLAFYQERQAPCHASLFYFLYDPIADFVSKDQSFTWIPYSTAHTAALDTSVAFSSILYKTLQPLHQQGMFQLHTPKGLPVKPLIGIQAPAVLCEIGLNNKDAWHLFVPLLTEGVVSIVRWAQQKNIQPTPVAETIPPTTTVIL
ncbi:MAG: hypothetical protein UV38_C0003G0080 [candidate division TM6 bacterium GW2011_GWE2_42_60]|nr:MAG: hypothetical protein UV38_C0003G0080 [candidate division TM6 bacterium GW2011_GWE2_42_60]HBY05440.1 hypothetical protein [Candidatus Dependentiae bacterium]